MKNIAKYIKISLLALPLTAIIMSGCESLEETPTSFVAPGIFYKNVAQGEAAMVAAMACWYEEWNSVNYGWAQRLFMHTDLWKGGSFVLSSSHGNGFWETHYKSLTNLDMILRSIANGEMQGDEEEITILLAQARFLRGLNYYWLVRLYGDVPLYLEDELPASQNLKARAPKEEVYEQIIKDLEYAIENLPAKWPVEQQGRIDKFGARGFLAQVYLTMATAPLNATEYYAKAKDEAAGLLADPEFHYILHEDVNEVFSQANKYGKENLFSINITPDDGHTSSNMYGPTEIGGWRNLTADVSMDTLWADQPRKEAYLLTWLAPGYGGWSGDSLHYTQWGQAAPNVKKYLFPYITQQEWGQYWSYSNIPILRVAELYLILAESANMAAGGPTQEAVDAINTVIRRANGGQDNPNYPELTTAMTMEEFDAAVIDERRWELCFEFNHRYFDLIRKRKLREVSPQYDSEWNDKLWLFPIPMQDLRLNNLLVQNPGWDTPAQ